MLAKLTAMDTDGFLLEEEGSGVEEREDREQDCFEKQVIFMTYVVYNSFTEPIDNT